MIGGFISEGVDKPPTGLIAGQEPLVTENPKKKKNNSETFKVSEGSAGFNL